MQPLLVFYSSQFLLEHKNVLSIVFSYYSGLFSVIKTKDKTLKWKNWGKVGQLNLSRKKIVSNADFEWLSSPIF